MDEITEWWHPEIFASKKEALLVRSAVRTKIQLYFSNTECSEVETPILQVSPGLEPHLTAFSTQWEDPTGKSKQTFYLHTSPEFSMKKLLVAGAGDIFQFARVFRNKEDSITHVPEFVMLEWYRKGKNYFELMDDVVKVMHCAADVSKDGLLRWKGKQCDPYKKWQRITVVDAFIQYAGIEIRDTFFKDGSTDRELLRERAEKIGIIVQREDSWEDIFFRIFLDRVERNLGIGAPTILYDYPICMAALSRQSEEDLTIAERFEVYICGLELANGFGELTDPEEQRRRFNKDMELKQLLYGYKYPIDEEFISALGIGMPESSGIALGFDRLVMLIVDAHEINDVLWIPWNAPLMKPQA